MKTVPDNSVRPATDKVKGAIFNVMQSRVDWSEATVLDLFAGSGSVGIEALSRGAKKVVFVENSRAAMQFLKSNLESIGANGNPKDASHSQVVQGDVFQFLKSAYRKYDVVFADPPYALESLPELPNRIFDSNIVSDDGFLIIEHPTRFEFQPGPHWEIAIQKSYGRTTVSFFQHQKTA
ncbi:MAG: 16S rRNA (guanine(966)-N(2))-methyltransferase RsmD [Bacteroidota bacterium]